MTRSRFRSVAFRGHFPAGVDPFEPDPRYKVVFTPVGWQVVDTVEARDPVAEYGLGDDEYARAKAFASMRNLDAQGRRHDA